MVTILSAFAFIPAIILGIAVYKHGVNVPVWDDWERGLFLKSYFEGTLEFKDLYAPYIDHRMLIPRLIVIANAHLTGGNLRAELFLNFALYFGSAILLYRLLQRCLGKTALCALVMFLINLVLFSPAMFQNFLWAILLSMMLPFACLGVVIWAMATIKSLWAKFLLVSLACLIGMHSFSHGIALWPVAIGLAICWKDPSTFKSRLVLAGGLVAIAALSCWAYFTWNFENTAIHAYNAGTGDKPPGFSSMGSGEFKKLTRFALTLSGSQLARAFANAEELAVSCGRTVLATFLSPCCFGCDADGKTQNAGTSFSPGWQPVASDWSPSLPLQWAESMSVLEKALLLRYSCLPMFIVIASIVLIARQIQLWSSEDGIDSGQREFRSRVGLVLALIAAGFYWPIWTFGLEKMKHWEIARHQELTSVLFIDHFEPDFPGLIDKDLEFATPQAHFLNEQGLLNPPLIETLEASQFEIDDRPLELKRASVEKAYFWGELMFMVEGFAHLRGPDRIADAIIFTNEADQIVKVTGIKPAFVSNTWFLDNVIASTTNFSRRSENATWKTNFHLDNFPKDQEIVLKVWAFDAENLRLQQIDQIIRLDPKTVKHLDSVVFPSE